MPKIGLGNVVWIKWYDHYSRNNGWVNAHAAKSLADKEYLCNSVGLVVAETTKQVTVAQQWNYSIDEDHIPMAADFMTIMKNSIKSTKVIKSKELVYK